MRNFGQMAVITAGTNAQYTVLMDSDLQDRPEHMSYYIKKSLKQVADIISQKEKRRKKY